MTNTTTPSRPPGSRNKRILAAAGSGLAVIVVGGALAGGTAADRTTPTQPAAAPAERSTTTGDTDPRQVDGRGRIELPASPARSDDECGPTAATLTETPGAWERTMLDAYGERYTVAVPAGWTAENIGDPITPAVLVAPNPEVPVAVVIGVLPSFGDPDIALLLEDYLLGQGVDMSLPEGRQVRFAGHPGCQLTGTTLTGEHAEILFAVTPAGDLLISVLAASPLLDDGTLVEARAVAASLTGPLT